MTTNNYKMKKFLLLTTLFCLTNLLAQNKVAEKVTELQELKANFIPVSVLAPTPNVTDDAISKVVDGATLATINFEKVNEIVSNQYDAIELQIPYQNQNISVLLYKVNPFAEGFHVDTNKGRSVGYQKGVYYRGIVEGNIQSVSSFNFFNGEFNGIVSSSELGNLVVGKLIKPNNQRDYIVYSDAKMKVLNDFDCSYKSQEKALPKSGATNRSSNSARCVSFYFEVDNTLFGLNGSDVATTTNWMTSVFNNIQTLFNNDGVTVGLKSIFIWTDPDPYEDITPLTAGNHLTTFRSNTPVFDGDVGMQVGIDPQPSTQSGLGGVAYVDTLCSTNAYGYVDVYFGFSQVPTYSWTVEATTHEFGHSLGSDHTHDCSWNGNNTRIDGCGPQAGAAGNGTCAAGPIPASGTIMSYCHLVSGVGINLNNGFGPQPAALILNNVNSSTCLSSDCTTSCSNTVTDLTIANITTNSVQVDWFDIGSTTIWQIAITALPSSPIVWITVDTNSYLATGLNPNTYYKIRVRPLCSDTQPTSREQIFATSSTNFCSSLPFTDTGGASSDYTNMESWIRTMTPYNSGLKLRVTFSSFDLETGFDKLYIYNGSNENYPSLTPSGLTGAGTPGVYNSTASDGSLTFRFSSDQFEVGEGWTATITCTGTLGEETVDFLDFSYYPNPTTGKVNITSKDAITEVAVYNVQGQLLFNQKMNELTTNIDISQFARGTYFFKLKINDREANFKILKM